MRSFWRFGSPSALLLALLLCPLPWVEIRCVSDASPDRLTSFGVPEHVANFVQPRQSEVLYEQSALQAIRGTCSAVGDESKMSPEDQTSRQEMTEALLARMKHSWRSWLMAAYLGALLTSVAIGLLHLLGRRRLLTVALLNGIALTLVSAEVLVGFPLPAAFVALDEPRTEPVPEPSAGPSLGGFALTYTGWFWMAQFLIVTSLGLLTTEWWLLYRQRRRGNGSSQHHLRRPRLWLRLFESWRSPGVSKEAQSD